MRVEIKPTTNKKLWYYNYAGSVVDVKRDSSSTGWFSVVNGKELFPSEFVSNDGDEVAELMLGPDDFDMSSYEPIKVVYRDNELDELKTKVPMFIMLNICTDKIIKADYSYLLTLDEAKDYLNTHTENMSSIKLIEVTGREFNASVDFNEKRCQPPLG